MSNELHKKYLLLGFVSVCNFGTAYMWSHALCNNSEKKNKEKSSNQNGPQSMVALDPKFP